MGLGYLKSSTSYRSYISTTKTRYPSKATWMSEISCSLGQANGSGRDWSGGYDPTINNVFMFSGLMFRNFVLAQEPHCDFWTLVSNGPGCSPTQDPSCVLKTNSNGWTDGVIYYDGEYASNGNHDLYISKHFWMSKHFGNFVKPGSQRRPIDNDASLNSMDVSTANKYYILAKDSNSAKHSEPNIPRRDMYYSLRWCCARLPARTLLRSMLRIPRMVAQKGSYP
ncbi:hypothetical protein EV421DRAFT_138468 [Armillaria borealis]|uniref:Uncharacterized protein n=1 Tax=Armillaria borealis TaxID=47425 RepID=A0AA39MFL4_9AGAR|nr:hypothetical protein EV421DRAFT_138468 [Armillaria borealis]